MKRFFENKIAYAAILILFTCALTWNLVHGSQAFSSPHVPAPAIVRGELLSPTSDAIRVAHGPTMPPDGGMVRVAHGPTMPPDGGMVQAA